jgi:hypothetical protein
MPKEMVSMPEGDLLRVAATKSISNLSALKEKTRVDRKTLRAINEGKPVKQTTLQSIADRLRVPISHLMNADTNEDAGSSINELQYREIKLQQLDAAGLRKLARETDEITWFLNINQMDDWLEGRLLELRNSLKGWFECINGGPGGPDDPEYQDSLRDQISYVKTSVGIDKAIEELARHKLKIFGGTYVAWKRSRPRHFQEDYSLPILKYRSQLQAALSVVPEEQTNSTVRVCIGKVPPRKFVESQLVGIDFVEIDGVQAWTREFNFDDEPENTRTNPDDIPF